MTTRRMRWLAGLLLAIPGPAMAADFRIGEVAFVPADILDARALPVPDGPPIIMITFAEAALPKLSRATDVGIGDADVAVTLDGKLLTRLVVRGPRQEPVLTIGGTTSLPEAERVAKAISGKDPLPDSLDE